MSFSLPPLSYTPGSSYLPPSSSPVLPPLSYTPGTSYLLPPSSPVLSPFDRVESPYAGQMVLDADAPPEVVEDTPPPQCCVCDDTPNVFMYCGRSVVSHDICAGCLRNLAPLRCPLCRAHIDPECVPVGAPHELVIFNAAPEENEVNQGDQEVDRFEVPLQIDEPILITELRTEIANLVMHRDEDPSEIQERMLRTALPSELPSQLVRRCWSLVASLDAPAARFGDLRAAARVSEDVGFLTDALAQLREVIDSCVAARAELESVLAAHDLAGLVCTWVRRENEMTMQDVRQRLGNLDIGAFTVSMHAEMHREREFRVKAFLRQVLWELGF
jgi:hypothetical protein